MSTADRRRVNNQRYYEAHRDRIRARRRERYWKQREAKLIERNASGRRRT
jgi:hypothetical protein